MARIKLQDSSRSPEYRHMIHAAAGHGEDNDCSVKAIAIATGAPYGWVRDSLAKLGRKPGKGTQRAAQRTLLEAMGYQVKRIVYLGLPGGKSLTQLLRSYPGQHGKVLKTVTTHHPMRFEKQFKAWSDGGTYLAFTNRHVAAIKGDVVHDWTKGRPCRITEMWQIVRLNKKGTFQ